jgi:hypothetical protein
MGSPDTGPPGMEESGAIQHYSTYILSQKSSPVHRPWSQGAAGQDCADRRAGRGRVTGAPISGAGLDPSCAPAGIPSSGSDGEGCWGEETAGANAVVGVDVGRVVAVPVGGAAVVRFVEPGAAAQQLGDPPSPLSLEALGRAGHGQSHGGQTAGAAGPGCGRGPDGHVNRL